MVGIVSGNSLGLDLTSGATLGQRGQLGQSALGQTAERSYVNVATGNLVVQDVDDFLASNGLDVTALRTYNSQGLLDDDNADNWSNGFYKKQLQFTGAAGSTGTVTRTAQDGSQAVYIYDAGRSAATGKPTYVTTAGVGAYDTISYSNAASQYTWTDGDSGISETYTINGANEARLTSATDHRGGATSYEYKANGLISKVTGGSGEAILYDYDDTTKRLMSVKYVATSGAQTAQVSFTYDGSARLATSAVDLTPENLADNATPSTIYTTTYTYDGASKRLASITQGDKTTIKFTYTLSNGVHRVTRVEDGLGKITNYTYTANQTAVKDALGNTTTYNYDASGQLLKITSPAVDGAPLITEFTYDGAGNLTDVVDATGARTKMEYVNGNQTFQRDAAGNTVQRTFDERNNLLTETRFAQAAAENFGAGLASQPKTTRYLYDGTDKNLLLYAISAEGRVTGYEYNALNQLEFTREYHAASFQVSTLAPDAILLDAWASGRDHRVTQYKYDFRGQLDQHIVFAPVGNSTTATASTTFYVRDAGGNLRETTSSTGSRTQYLYDGLNRVHTFTNGMGEQTLTSWNDAGSSVSVTQANGLVTTTLRDKAGRVTSVVEGFIPAAGSPMTVLGTTRYAWDAAGQLVMVEDPTQERSFMLYDAAGRKVADIDATGTLTEYSYNKNNLLTRSYTYSGTALPESLFVTAGVPRSPMPTLASLQSLVATPIANTATDIQSWRIYDSANRLVREIDGRGAVTDTVYNALSQVVSVTQRANRLADVSALGKTPTLAQTQVAANAGEDRAARNFHDADGLLLAELDAEGYLSEHTYNYNGELVRTIRYATQVEASLRTAQELADLRPSTDSQKDAVTWFIRDAGGRVAGEVDAEGYLTEKQYDSEGRLTASVRYDNKVAGTMTFARSLGDARPTATNEARTTTWTYDNLNRISRETDAQGTVTQYTYDNAGHLVKTERALGTAELRTSQVRYDIQGRLIGELTAEGALALAAPGAIAAQVWSQWGITHAYDAAGRRTGTTDQYGNKTRFYYDGDSRLTHTIDALGGITENQYNVLGQLKATVRYATAIAPATLATLIGGLVTSALTTAIAAAASDSSDSKTSYAWNLGGALDSVTDATGVKTSYLYNAFGQETSRTRSLGAVAIYTQLTGYDSRGQVTSTKADDGGLNAWTTASYDAFGRVVKTTDANWIEREYRYDKLGRQIALENGLGRWSSTSYDAFDRILSTTDELNQTTTYSYDLLARSVRVTTPEGFAVTTTFNRFGQTLTVSDARNAADKTTYDYDDNGNLTRTTFADGTSTSTDYDRAARIVKTTDAGLNEVQLAYDGASRLLTRTVNPGGLNLVTTYGWDAKGQQVRITDANQVVTQLDYDLNGRLVKQTVDPTVAGGAVELNLVTSFSYDASGNLQSIVRPNANATGDGAITLYFYDKLGRRTREETRTGTTVADPFTTGTIVTARDWQYDKVGNLLRAFDGNGNSTRYVYDADNQLRYTIDALGNVQGTNYTDTGLVYQRRTYAQAISLTSLPAAPTLQDIEALLAPSQLDRFEGNLYDKDGRVTATLNSLGHVVHYQHDASGNLIERRAYVNAVTSWDGVSVPQPAPDARDERIRTVYDKLNRAIYTIDGNGAVVAQAYNANGQVQERRAYAVAIAPETAATQTALAQAVALIADDTRDVRTSMRYDRAGRLEWTADGMGAVTQRSYDKNGNLSALRQYATPLAAGLAPSQATANWMTDRVTNFTWDAANRQVFTVQATRDLAGDLGGAVTRNHYDGNGNLTRRTSYAKLLTTLPTTTGTIETALGATQADDRVEQFAYDAANRRVYSIDGANAVTKLDYDSAGNVVKTTRYATTMTTAQRAGLSTNASANDILVRTSATPSLDRIERSAYDAANRLRYAVDGAGTVRETSFDALGRLTSTVLHARQVTFAHSATVSLTDIKSALGSPLAADRTESYNYDSQGRLLSSTDALGYTESYSYDAIGRKQSFTNKAGAVWTYQHDASGRVTTETSPTVLRTPTSLDAAGNLVLGTPVNVQPQTHLSYDALGNLLQRKEAAGLDEERITRYEYDSLGRQVATIHGDIQTRTWYDTLGNAVAGMDQAGNYSYKSYDRAGQLAFEIDAGGYMTAYERNAFGEVKTLTRYNGATTAITPTPAGLTYAQAKARAIALDVSQSRSIETVYDTAGRVKTVTEPAGFIYDADTGTTSVDGRASTSYAYNAFGQVTRSSDGKGTTDHFYDAGGLEVATLDAMGFLTKREFFETGELKKLTEFATAVTVPASYSATRPADPATTREDRVTEFTYDLAGRKLSETRRKVEVTSGSTSAGHASGTFTVSTTTPVKQTLLVTTPANSGTRIADVMFFAGADGSSVIQWPTPPAGTIARVSWRVQGTDTWTSASDLIVTDGASQSISIGADTTPNILELELTWTQGNAVVGRETSTLTISPRTGAAPTSSITGIANTIVALLNGVRVLKWPTPAEGVVATIQIKPPGSTQWETWPVKTEGSIQYVVLSSSLQAGTYQVELDLQRLNSATPVQDLQTLYQYDKLGNLTQTTDALGNNSYSYYDAQGRVTATVTPAIGLASEGGTITPLAEYYHDALGNVVGKVAKANGVASANADGYVRVDAGLNPADRTDRYKVDRFGHITQITNAQGVSSFMSYDRMGRLERTWQGVTTATGAATIYQAFEYDKAGRVVRVRQPSPTTLTGAVGESVTVMGYNGFGEMTSRRVDALEAEYFEYSTAGRLWRTNADDGIDRIYLYDLQGRVTQEIRSAGRETGPVNIITVLNPATAATSTDVRRTITQYDKLGRVIKTMMPQRQDSQGGVTVSHMTTAASITQQASVVRDDYSSGYVSGNYHWTMPNRVQLSWASLASLGSGDIKVELKYTSAAFNIPEVTVETGANGELTTYPAINFYATATSITKTFTAEEAASGPVMEWLDQGSIGGISAVNGLTVWKKDINGQWVKLIDQNALGDGSNSITIAAPTALDTAIVMQVRDLGNTSETAWRDLVTTNFGDQLYFDTSGLASDVYEYRVRTKRVADTAWAVTSSGVIDLNPPLVAKITTAITPAATFATTPGAGYSWTSPGASVVQTWRYRAAGTTGVWLSLPVASRGTGIDGVDASALPPGLYDYELLYNQPGEMRPYARASGQMTVAPSQGIEPVSGMTATGRTDGTALLQWTKPTDTTVTSVLRIKPPGGTLTAVTIGLDASGLKQQYVLPANSAYGTHQFEITQTRGGVVIAITTGSITMSQGAVPAAVITETTPAYIALTAPYAEPAAGAAPRVSGFQFQTAANGGWNVSWTAPTSPQDTQVFARLRGDTAWTLVTAPTLTVAAGRQRLDLNANVLQAGDYDLKVLTRSGTTVTGFTSAVVTIAADTNVAATAAITTPPQATFAANADSSWSLQWTKPPVGSDVYLKYRRAGTADTWNNAAFADVAGTSFQKADVSPTGLTQGTWEFDLYFVDRASGQRTEAALRNVTVTPPVYKAATQVVTTDPLTTKPPIPGLTWSTTAGVGSTFTWSPLAAGTVLTVKSRLKGTTTWPASSIWQFVPPQTSQMIPAGTFVDGTYEIELTVTSGATVLSCSRRENTVTNGNIASVDTTVTAITPTFSSTASNGEWKLQWTPPATGTLQLRFRTAGSSDAWVDASTRVSGTTTKSVTFFAYEAAPGTYEMELFYTDASGKVTHRAKSNITVSSVVTAPTFAPTAAAATPPTLATISARPDGGFRLTWTAAAGTVSSTFKLIDAYGGVVINPGVIQVSGTSRWIDIADTLAPGIVSFEIADFNGLNGTGTRLDQAFGKVTVANDSPAATLVQNYAAITPAPVAKANADGSWSLTWVTPPAGTTAKLNYRIAGGSWAAWPDAITTSGGNSSVNVAPTRLVAGTYEFDLYFERSSTRTNQTFKRIVVSAPGVAAPTVSIAPSTYVPKSYTLTQTTAALAAVTSAVQTFVVSAAPEGISNFSHT
ncbi:RHS repeat protein, partial [Caenimonas sp. SL110]|uniref:RHS repeat protein n=1 Tax=Caenimonas sp. SL110 TaxID=1450524 RepID=UPI00065492CA